MLLAIGSISVVPMANAQRVEPVPELRVFSEQRIQHQKILGLALGGYALANIAVGSIAAGQTTGETRYMHRMNVYWNLVNLGIAGAGLLGARKANAANEPLPQAVRRHETMKQVLLFNAGLDVAYIAGGAYLSERAMSHPNKQDQLRGYGKSIMMQGGFLLAFDLVNYAIFKRRGDRQEMKLLSASPMGAGFVVPIK
ncbi:hypothetical protein WBJ53_09650 [Spirosoma sp. SC4-14]|uniref:DUF6992 family protein n=1 Tax=Spirosoma sp. SC4-14 TaxID=3128900 RepID=UPI0030D298B3